MKYLILSGRQDSNLRPPGPKPGAMTGLRYAPNLYLTICIRCGETGTRTQATVTRRQISNLLRYHSGTSPTICLRTCFVSFAVAKVLLFSLPANFLATFFLIFLSIFINCLFIRYLYIIFFFYPLLLISHFTDKF